MQSLADEFSGANFLLDAQGGLGSPTGPSDEEIAALRARQAELDAAMRSGEMPVQIGGAQFGQVREPNVPDRVRMIAGFLAAGGGAVGAPALVGPELMASIAARSAAVPAKDAALEALFQSGLPQQARQALTGVAGAAGGFLLPGLAQAQQGAPAGQQPAQKPPAQPPQQIDYGIERQVSQDQTKLTPQQFMEKYGTMDGQKAMQKLQMDRAAAKPWYQFW